ncbi:MAG: DinB family protein [Actinomycetota bacterium]
MTDTTTALATERADLLDALATHRDLFRFTVQGLTDEQAALTPTTSELCLGGLIKHVTRMESRWHGFITDGPAAMALTEDSYAEHAASFRMLPGETLAGLLERFDEVTARTDELIRTLPDLDASQPLPEAPWFEPGARWTARRVFAHILAEMTQHAGHADILREAIDGQKTMG